MADQIKELLLQALETELGGVQIYTAAISCAENRDLRDEWKKYLDETKRHVEVVAASSRTSASTPTSRRRAGGS
jgi:rubrerythrin